LLLKERPAELKAKKRPVLAPGTGDGGRETTVFCFVEGSPVNQGSKRTMLVERLATTGTIDQGSGRRAQPR